MALTGLTNLQPLHIKTVGIGTFDNTVSIGGTLTYEDVTNVDAIGIITARSGVNVSGGQLDVGSNIKLGNAGVITATSFVGSGSGLTGLNSDLVNDSSPQLGGDLDVNGKKIKFPDLTGSVNNILYFGTGDDLLIYHHADVNVIQCENARTLRFQYWTGSANETLANFIPNGSVELYFNNNKRFTSSNYGTDLFGQSTAAQLRFKTQEGTNRGMIGVTNANDISILDAQDHAVLRGYKDGACELYYDNTKRLETSATGATVTGNITAAKLLSSQSSGSAGLSFGDGVEIHLGTGDDLQLYHNTHSYLVNNTGAFIIQAANGNEIQLNGNGQHAAKFNPTGTSYIYYNGSVRFSIGATNTVHSEDFVPGGDNTYDLGTTNYRWRNIYTGDLHCSNKGSSNDVDGTWGDYTIQEGESDLFLINNRSGKKYKFNLTEVS